MLRGALLPTDITESFPQIYSMGTGWLVGNLGSDIHDFDIVGL